MELNLWKHDEKTSSHLHWVVCSTNPSQKERRLLWYSAWQPVRPRVAITAAEKFGCFYQVVAAEVCGYKMSFVSFSCDCHYYNDLQDVGLISFKIYHSGHDNFLLMLTDYKEAYQFKQMCPNFETNKQTKNLIPTKERVHWFIFSTCISDWWLFQYPV